ncbi:Gfo/Idh/MocA family oxidoreductase [uncultured Roseobacter sp.]|uniref:Gfo/Idh/MocA family protein n=1 Tax=uncultured Roseobacter sp. TaxID=114847 RepID=UPI0026067905|nr:Gfo/Idh/MocA family oxidoreductase [uncultured Roseobacter sp.]
MSTPDTLRVACLGAGYFSQFHYDAWSRIEGVETIASADLNIAAAQATGLPAFGSLAAMLDAGVPDILDIILPPPGHATSVRRAIAAGVGTIICQKPFCLDLREAREIVEEARAAGVTLVVHENFRFMPWYRVIRDQIACGRIGRPMQATFRLRPGDGQGPEAYLDRQPYFQQMPRFLIHETGVHWIDTFRFIFGDPTAVYADLRQLNPAIAGEDAGMVHFDHPDGVRTVFDGNRLADHVADNLRRTMGEAVFEGTDGCLTLLGDGSVSFRAFGSDKSENVLAPDEANGFGGDCVRHLQAHVVDCVRTGRTPENTAADYLTVIAVRDAIYASAENGRKVML